MPAGFVLLIDCLRHAAQRLERLTSHRMRLRIHGGRVVPLAELTTELGDADREMVATIVAVSGNLPDTPNLRFILALVPTAMLPLATIAAGPELAKDPGMAASVLQEMGNIGATAIANRFGERLDTTTRTSAPDVVRDHWGSILAAVLGSFPDPQDEIAILTTELVVDGRIFPGSACMIADRRLAAIPGARQQQVKGI